MYIYLENDYFIPLDEIVVATDLNFFLKSEEGKAFFEAKKNEIINLSKKEKYTIIITETLIYITSYSPKTIYQRGNEFNRIKSKGKLEKE